MRNRARALLSCSTFVFALPTLAAAGSLGSLGCGSDNPPPATTPVPSATTLAAAPLDAGAAGRAGAKPEYPLTEKRATYATYGTLKVEDDYAWLESPTDPGVKEWIADQAGFARAALDKEPLRDSLGARLKALIGAPVPKFESVHEASGTVLALEDAPPKQQALLVVLSGGGLDDPSKARVLVDPNQRDSTGKTSIDWFVLSHDGKRVAVSLSAGGSESGDLHLFEVATGKELGDVIPHVNGGTAGGSVAWSADGKRIFYTKYIVPATPDGRERQQVYVHTLGAAASADMYVIGQDFPDIAEIELETLGHGSAVLARVALGDGGDFSQWISSDGKTFRRLADVPDQVFYATLGDDGFVYLLSRNGADRGKVLRTKIAGGTLAKAETVLAEGDASMTSLVAGSSWLYVDEVAGGPSRVVAVPISAGPISPKATPKVVQLPIPDVSTAQGLALSGKNDLFVNVQSYTKPLAWFRWRADKKTLDATKLVFASPADFSDTDVTRGKCTSKDGTQVPLTILSKKGTAKDGSNPTLLTGYGGYNVSMQPTFRPLLHAWLEHGGVWALANLRGGGELGAAWHRGGMLTNKQNVFDDLYACAGELGKEGFTSPEHLAIQGRSNGGLLMGAELTQHPEAFRAVVAQVGIHDMLKVESTPNGAFNVPEFGTVRNPDQLAAMYKYSPYHNVKDGTAYPAVLFTTGANDPRVDPYHSRKMVARLQAATSSTHPILLRVSDGTGHGRGTPLDATIKEWVDVYSFLFGELGMK